uniref:Uncharacterized protein n=1 Tax=Chaetoceros debilis TaxID=122233 RepID=A0A7S3V9N3_9STRA
MKFYLAAAFLFPLHEAFAFHTAGAGRGLFSISSPKSEKSTSTLFASSSSKKSTNTDPSPFEKEFADFPSYEKQQATAGKVTLPKPSTFKPNPNANRALKPGQEAEVYDIPKPKPKVSSLNVPVDTASISKNLEELKGKVKGKVKVNFNLNAVPVPPPSLSLPAVSLSTDVLTQGGAVIGLAATALITVRTTKAQREKAEAKKKSDAEAKAKAEKLTNRIGTKVIAASKNVIGSIGSTSDVVKTNIAPVVEKTSKAAAEKLGKALTNIAPVVEKTSKGAAEKLGKALNTDVDPDALAKATGALGGSVAAIGLIVNVNSSNSGNTNTTPKVERKEQVKSKPMEKKPVVKAVKAPDKERAQKVIRSSKVVEPKDDIIKPKEVVRVVEKKEEPAPMGNPKTVVRVEEKQIVRDIVSSSNSSKDAKTLGLPTQTDDINNVDFDAIAKNPLVIVPFAALSIRAALVNSKAKRELQQMEVEKQEFYDALEEKVEKAKRAAAEIERFNVITKSTNENGQAGRETDD